MGRVVRVVSAAPSAPQDLEDAHAAGRPRGVGYRPSVDDALFRRTVQDLTAADPQLAELVEVHGIPPLWLRPAGFPSLVLFILEQQVSLASAAAAYRKVATRTGAMTPTAVLATTPEELRLDGVSRQKDRYLRALATAVETGALDLAGLAALDDEEVRRDAHDAAGRRGVDGGRLPPRLPRPARPVAGGRPGAAGGGGRGAAPRRGAGP